MVVSASTTANPVLSPSLFLLQYQDKVKAEDIVSGRRMSWTQKTENLGETGACRADNEMRCEETEERERARATNLKYFI